VACKCLFTLNFTAAGKFETFFGTTDGFNFWHGFFVSDSFFEQTPNIWKIRSCIKKDFDGRLIELYALFEPRRKKGTKVFWGGICLSAYLFICLQLSPALPRNPEALIPALSLGTLDGFGRLVTLTRSHITSALFRPTKNKALNALFSVL